MMKHYDRVVLDYFIRSRCFFPISLKLCFLIFSRCLLFLLLFFFLNEKSEDKYFSRPNIFSYAVERGPSQMLLTHQSTLYSLYEKKANVIKRTVEICDKNSFNKFATCLHDQREAESVMPLEINSGLLIDPESALSLLEENHREVRKGKRFLAFRHGGPFNSVGYGFNMNSTVNEEHTAMLKKLNSSFLKTAPLPFHKKASLSHAHNPSGFDVSDVKIRWRNNWRKKRIGRNSAMNNIFVGFLRLKESAPLENATTGDNTVQRNLSNQSFVARNEGSHRFINLSLATDSIPITQLRDNQYVGLLGIGTPFQFVRPIFDTGSTNLWVISDKCKSETCRKVTQFKPSKSSTFRYVNPPIFLDVTFGTGKLSGKTGMDDFLFGPYHVKNQTFGLATMEAADKVHGNIFEQINFEGIVGLAFPEMSSTGSLPIYDHIVETGVIKNNEFSFYVAKESTVSAIFFGGVNPNFFEPPIHMFPVEREHYWETKLDSLYIGDKKFCCDDKSKSYVIFDSGTSFNTLPSNEIKSFFELIPSKDCNDENVDSVLSTYPTIKYVIHGVELTLKPEQYMLRSTENSCTPAYMQIDVPSEFGHAYILGNTAFMRHYFTVFKRGNNGTPSMVGVAKAKHSQENEDYLHKIMHESLKKTNGNSAMLIQKKQKILRNMKNHLF